MTITSVPDEQTAPPEPMEDEETFEEMAAAMPETARGFLDALQEPSADAPSILDSRISTDDMAEQAEERRIKTIKMSKKMKKSMDKLKGKAAEAPIMWFHQQAKEHPEWELDEDEKDLIRDSIETVFEVLDIQVEIQPLAWTLTSIWWILGYPVAAFAFLFLVKKSASIEREQQIGTTV